MKSLLRQHLNKDGIALAREEHKKRGINFGRQVKWHMKHGFVISVPYHFTMGYFFKDGEDIVLHVTYATGELLPLFRSSLNYSIDKIEFHRNFTGKLKRYDYQKFLSRVK